MNDTTATTALPATEVAAFATAVRVALSDLPPDELDELTDGLEADLAERAAEAAEPALGDPGAYAEELRAAAGYPPRSARSHLGDTLPNLRTLPQEVLRRWNAHVARHAWLRSFVDFALTLRPVWWVFRGVTIYALVAATLGFDIVTWWPIGLAATVLSVQLGRGRMLGRSGVLWSLRVVSIIALIAAPPLIQRALDQWANAAYSQMEGVTYGPQGLTSNGSSVDNIYAYDADGERIDQVQLFDQNGDPLNLVGDTSADFWGAQDGSMVVPSSDVPGRVGWNVYPLAHANSWSDYEDDGMLDESEISKAVFPVDHVKALSVSSADATGTQSTVESGVAAPDATATPAP